MSVRYSWADAESRRHGWGQVLRFRDGLIIDMDSGPTERHTARLFDAGF